MTKLLNLAWRNLWRNRRRSLITMAAIAFALIIVAATRSLQYGTYDTMESLAVRLYNGEIQLQRCGFHDEQTLSYFLLENELNWNALLENFPEITAYTRRVTGFGLVSSNFASTGALIVGIEPDKEGQVTKFASMVKVGQSLQSGDDHDILLGKTLATNLQVHVGDTVVVLTQGYRNELGADSYIVKGMVSIGYSDLDRGIMIMPLHNAQELFSMQDGVTQVVFRTVDFRQADQYASALSKELNPERYDILSWQRMMPELRQVILIDNISGAIYLAFLLIVVGFEIFNTTMMSVMERVKEFGMLQSMGMKPYQTGSLIFLESTVKLLVSLIIGLLISFALVSFLSQYSIPLSDEIKEGYAEYGFILEDLKFSTRLRVYVEPFVSIFLIALFAIIFPVFKTIKLTPVEAFRKT
ncbi:MAG: ABC transporter permease [bacterium]